MCIIMTTFASFLQFLAFSHTFFKLLALISDGKLKIKHEHTKSARLVYLNTRDICPNMRSAYIIRDLFVTENNA